MILLAGVGAVGLGLREWASSGNRRPMLLGDVLGMMALVVGAIGFPDVLTVAGMITGVVAGGFAVAKPSRSATDGDRTTTGGPDRLDPRREEWRRVVEQMNDEDLPWRANDRLDCRGGQRRRARPGRGRRERAGRRPRAHRARERAGRRG